MNTTDTYNAILETQSPSLTESVNPNTVDIDIVPTLTVVQLINDEDKKVAIAIEAELPQIAAAIDAIAERMQRGGRLIYMGAGTSGRLGVLDASEMPPTYSVPQGRVIGLIAGGLSALTNSIEGAEDEPEQGRAAQDIESRRRQQCIELLPIRCETRFRCRQPGIVAECEAPDLQRRPRDRPGPELVANPVGHGFSANRAAQP